MRSHTVLLLVFLFTTGCSATNEAQHQLLAEPTFELAEIEFRKQGLSPENRPYMKEICRGFRISENQVRNFFANADVINAAELNGDIQMLPCHSVGTIKLNDEKYSWVIRAGGIGEFYNDKNKFYKVCGKECCKNNPGLC